MKLSCAPPVMQVTLPILMMGQKGTPGQTTGAARLCLSVIC